MRHLGPPEFTDGAQQLAAAFSEDPGPIDLDAVFDMALAKVLDAFDPERG